jgi:hypothetical protein
MRSARRYLARYMSIFSNRRGLSLGLGLLLAAAGLVLGFMGKPETASAQEYSAYADPDKAVISVILSDEGNVEEFQGEFGLGDAEIEDVLAAVRQENEIIAQAYAESEQIVKENDGLSEEQIGEKIAASDYDETVRTAIAETKSTIEAQLPEDRRSQLEAWVNAKYAQAENEVSEETITARRPGSTRGRGVSCRVFATQYRVSNYEVALPHKHLKFAGGYKVRIRRGDHVIRAPVKEAGPWNIRDNYWQPRKLRTRWPHAHPQRLPRCIPEAEAAYFDNYNHGEDQYGREVSNPAGIDLTPQVASRIGLGTSENSWVYVRYAWAR